MRWRSFPFFRQLDSADCGPACLRMVAAYHGRHYALSELREYCHLDREGASLKGLMDAAVRIGLRPLAVRLPFEAGVAGGNSFQDVPLPCIVHWQQRHFVVVYKMDRRHVWTADPAKGKSRMDFAAFRSGWESGEDGLGTVLLLEPTESFQLRPPLQTPESAWRLLGAHFWPFRRLAIPLIWGILLVGILQLIFPFLTQAIVDIGIRNQDLGFIWLILIGQFVLFGTQIGVQYLQSWTLLHLTSRVHVSLVQRYLSKMVRLPLAFFDRKMMGDLLQRIQDHQRIEQFLAVSSLQVAFSAFSLLVFGIVLLWYSTLLFLVFVAGSLLYLAWIFLFLRRRAVVDQQRFEQLADNQNLLIEWVEGVQEIKLQASAWRHQEKWADIQRQLFRVNMRSLQLGQFQDVGGALINQAKDILITLLAAHAVIEGRLTLGMLLAVQYIVGQLNLPLHQLIQFVRHTQDAGISLERLREVHEEKPESAPVSAADFPAGGIEGDLELDGIRFRYHPLQAYVLEDVTVRIPFGQTTAIVGGSGSGKTTLVKLLLGLYQPETGAIRVGGRALQTIPPEQWRAQCGAVLQDSYIFSDTIARNMTEGVQEWDPVRLERVAAEAQILDFIRSLPLGFQTMIGHKGMQLSPGQRQRILLARVFYKAPCFLFLDEATNALDASNERRILDRLQQETGAVTRLIVAHRLNTVRKADQILVLERGRIVESGTHAQLIDRKGVYFELVRDQLSLGE